MKTIKERVLKAIKENGSLPRKKVTFEVLKNNGEFKGNYNNFKDIYSNKFRGYYSINYQQWENEGLITRNKGIYSITELGTQYLENPSIIRAINKKRKEERKEKLNNMRRHFIYDAIEYFESVGYDNMRSDERFYCEVLVNIIKKDYLN